jgi:hypothetical protein
MDRCCLSLLTIVYCKQLTGCEQFQMTILVHITVYFYADDSVNEGASDFTVSLSCNLYDEI